MDRQEQHMHESHNHHHANAVASENYAMYITFGSFLTLAGAATELLQLMKLNSIYFEDGYANVSALGWWTNLLLGLATVIGLAVLIHKLMKWIAGTTREKIYAYAGIAALLVILATAWMVGDPRAAQTGGGMGTGSDDNGSLHFVVTLIRSPLVILMALVAAFGLMITESGIDLRKLHHYSLKAMLSLEDAFTVLDDGVMAEKSLPRRRAELIRETWLQFARAFKIYECTRMDAVISLARGTALGGKGFVEEIEEGLNQGWASFTPGMREIAETYSTQDIDLSLLADEIGQLSNQQREQLVGHAANHKRRFSDRRNVKALNA